MTGDDEILGRLPRTRPGRRSPRRDESAELRARSAERANAATEKPRETAGTEAGGDQRDAADALAGLARTGVSVATGTVGLGLRAAGGALKAIRGTVERR